MTAAFYDEAMTAPDAPSMLPLEESPWRPVYEEAARWIAPCDPVIDLGCGTARFAHALYANGRYGDYSGVDFSPAALKVATRDVRKLGLGLGPKIAFICADLTSWTPPAPIAGNTIFTCLEVLEHLEDDLDLVRRIPPGHRFIFSLPNYPSEAHLRDFRLLRDVWERYGSLATFKRWSLIDLDGRHVIHLLDSTRRTESW
jgi:SAM-dependent methyltransferase